MSLGQLDVGNEKNKGYSTREWPTACRNELQFEINNGKTITVIHPNVAAVVEDTPTKSKYTYENTNDRKIDCTAYLQIGINSYCVPIPETSIEIPWDSRMESTIRNTIRANAVNVILENSSVIMGQRTTKRFLSNMGEYAVNIASLAYNHYSLDFRAPHQIDITNVQKIPAVIQRLGFEIPQSVYLLSARIIEKFQSEAYYPLLGSQLNGSLIGLELDLFKQNGGYRTCIPGIEKALSKILRTHIEPTNGGLLLNFRSELSNVLSNLALADESFETRLNMVKKGIKPQAFIMEDLEKIVSKAEFEFSFKNGLTFEVRNTTIPSGLRSFLRRS